MKKILITLLSLTACFSLALFAACEMGGSGKTSGEKSAASYASASVSSDKHSKESVSSASENGESATSAEASESTSSEASESTSAEISDSTSEEGNNSTSEEGGQSGEDEQQATGYKVTFSLDDHVTVTVFKTQDMTSGGEQTTVSYSRDGSTGELTLTDGQINFILTFADGYELDTMSVDGTYNKIKGSSDTGVENGYRITKIASELTVTVTSKSSSSGEEEEEQDEDLTYSAVVGGMTITAEYTSGTEVYSASFCLNETSGYVKIEVTDHDLTGEAEITLSGAYSGSVWILTSEDTDLVINFSGLTVTATGEYPAIYVSEAANVDISAKKGTENYIYDNRSAVESLGSAIYAAIDLKLKGTGALTVVSANNNGIHTKDDLTVQKLTLSVTSVDNALKGNDGVSITSGTLTLVSKQGDGIKTSNSATKYNEDGTVKKVQGTVSITGGTVNIYSASDGIDAAYNVEISGSPEINVYTTKTYAGSLVETAVSNSDSYYYIRYTSSAYNYSVYFYNPTSGESVWVNPDSYDSVSGSSGGMGGGRPGWGGGMGGSTTYYYYRVPKPEGTYTTMILYMYSGTQSQGQNTSYYAASDAQAINTARDTLSISSISTSSKKVSFSWTTYSGDTTVSSKGIKADNEIYISGGTIAIKSYDDGIHTNNDVVLGDEDDLTDDHYGTGVIYIGGGNITVTSKDDGVHADTDLYFSEDGGTLTFTVTTAYEGIEGNRIYFNGGTITVYATDDAVNAAQCNGSYTPLIQINGGYIDLATPSGDTDTLDSNGNVVITGGVLIVKNAQTSGQSMTGGTIDLDGTLTISGGHIISVGCWCTEANMTANASNTSTTLSAGTYTIRDVSGNVIVTFTLTTSYRGYRIRLNGVAGTHYLYRDETQITAL